MTVVPMSANAHMNWASRFDWRWHPPDSFWPELGVGLVRAAVADVRRDAVEPDRAAFGVEPAHHQRQVGLAVPGRGDLGLAVHLVHAGQLVVVLAAGDEVRAHDSLLVVDRPDPLAGPVVDDPLAGALPAVGRHGGASEPVVATDDKRAPHRSVAPAAGGGVRITNDSSPGQMPSDVAVRPPTMPSTCRSSVPWNDRAARSVASSNVPLIGPL